MKTLLDLSARFIDENLYEGPFSVNRVSMQLAPITEGIAMVEAFSHVVVFDTGDGLVAFDTSLEPMNQGILRGIRTWSDAPVHTVAYTHGHIDHIGGARAFVDEARSRGDRDPRFIGHRGVLARFDRYQSTNGYNRIINERQFSTLGKVLLGGSLDGRFGPKDWVRPDVTFDDRMSVRVGELTFHLFHDRGETDDHLWAWVPEKKALVVGDFVTWVFPNAGNPQKVQRYPGEWARALRTMASYPAELLLPAHGLPVGGADRIQRVLGDLATALESLVEQTLARMNEGMPLNQILMEVKVPEELMERPYLRPAYDEPEFVVRNIWRLYGGWYDGNPAHLKPPSDGSVAKELASLCGGAVALAERAVALRDSDPRLACELAQMAFLAAPDAAAVHAARAEVFRARRDSELSLMAKGIFGTAASESEARKKALEAEG